MAQRETRPIVAPRAHIQSLLSQGLAVAQEKRHLPALTGAEINVDYAPPDKADYASNLALRLSRALRMPPLQIAELIVESLPSSPMLAKVEVAPPGFVNFHLDSGWLAQQAEEIVRQGATYGNSALGAGTRVQVEFVSANPTGPLTIGSGRNAVIGDTLARVLAATGYDVQR